MTFASAISTADRTAHAILGSDTDPANGTTSSQLDAYRIGSLRFTWNAMNAGQWGDAGGVSGAAAAGKDPASASSAHSQQPARILVVDIHPPHWAHTCHKLCEALENVFSLACSLAGPSRIPLFSLYVAQNHQECLLPFVVRGGFSRLQSCIAKLRALPTEGGFRPKEDAVSRAVQDGLQQFKQYTGKGMAGASLSRAAVEITVLTSQLSAQMAKQLEAGLQDTDLVSLRQLQLVELTRGGVQEQSDQGSPSLAESTAAAAILGTDIDLQTVEDDVVALEMFFKAWFHDQGTNQEHLHLLLPSGAIAHESAGRRGSVCVKCDVQERLLSPALLPAACSDGTARVGDASGPFWMAPGQVRAPRKLRVLRALKAGGLCESVLFGLPLVVRPTSCWQLNWDELEANQQTFQALCHCLVVSLGAGEAAAGHRSRAALGQLALQGGSPTAIALGPCSTERAIRKTGLLPRGWGVGNGSCCFSPSMSPTGGGGAGGPSWGSWATTYQVLLPLGSGSLLLRSVAARELLLPCSVPLPPADPAAATLSEMEGILDSLDVELAYNPLSATTHLYRALRSSLIRPVASQPQRPAERPSPRQQGSRSHPSKARATVAPLRMALPTARLGAPLFSSEEDEFLEST
ncbi:meiosis 1 arrest protein-like [Elgaria multicarinata webbii]|uniref:meiosis 1 arrest protein-like n=1 Tax=Elgaria multicarinata webbii TaxID=159646 RepID=UPI002FCCCFFE